MRVLFYDANFPQRPLRSPETPMSSEGSGGMPLLAPPSLQSHTSITIPVPTDPLSIAQSSHSPGQLDNSNAASQRHDQSQAGIWQKGHAFWYLDCLISASSCQEDFLGLFLLYGAHLPDCGLYSLQLDK